MASQHLSKPREPFVRSRRLTTCCIDLKNWTQPPISQIHADDVHSKSATICAICGFIEWVEELARPSPGSIRPMKRRMASQHLSKPREPFVRSRRLTTCCIDPRNRTLPPISQIHADDMHSKSATICAICGFIEWVEELARPSPGSIRPMERRMASQYLSKPRKPFVRSRRLTTCCIDPRNRT